MKATYDPRGPAKLALALGWEARDRWMARRICFGEWCLYTSQLLEQVLAKNFISTRLQQKARIFCVRISRRKNVQCLHQTESCRVHLSSLGCHTKTATTINAQDKTPSRNVMYGFEKQKTRRFLLETRLKSLRLASLLDEKLSFSELGR